MTDAPNDRRAALEGWDPVPAAELEQARRRFAELARGDLDAEARRWSADGELHSSVAGVLEGQGGFRGPEGLRMFWRTLSEAFDEFSFTPREVRRRGSLTLMLGETQGRGRVSGMEIAVQLFWMAQRDAHGLIVWAQAFTDLDEALAEADRREPA